MTGFDSAGRRTGGQTLFVRQDRLDSVVLATEKDGSTAAVAGRQAYDPYGNRVGVHGLHTANGLPIDVPYGFAGARWEEHAGLYLMGHRWYEPSTGRFLEQDPIGESGGLNLYAYVGSSPTMWVDPTGLAAQGLATLQAEVRLMRRDPGQYAYLKSRPNGDMLIGWEAGQKSPHEEFRELVGAWDAADEAGWRQERADEKAVEKIIEALELEKSKGDSPDQGSSGKQNSKTKDKVKGRIDVYNKAGLDSDVLEAVVNRLQELVAEKKAMSLR